MNWTVETIEEIERHYQVFDSNEIARGLGIKPATLRKAFSKYGVDAPRCRKGRKEQARERLRRCAYKFQACFGWSYADIAEQMELPLWFVAAEVVEVVGKAVQMTLWPEERHEVRPRMRAVHVGKRRAVRRCEQLELFTEVTLAIAA